MLKTISTDLLGNFIKATVQTRLKFAKSNLVVVLVQEGSDLWSSALTDNSILRIASALAFTRAFSRAFSRAFARAFARALI